MAYQPKSYRKFVATAATAAMVASAVGVVATPANAASNFTDVAPQYKDAVDFLVQKGANGLTSTQFGISENIKRVDAAVIIANVLGLDVDKYEDAGFTDVPERAVKAVNALKAEGIINGKTATSFGSNDTLKRGEMALIIANAFDLVADEDTTIPFTDVNSRYEAAVKALYANNVTKGKTATSFGTDQNIMRGDFARFVYAASQVDVKTEVVSVSAINQTSLKVTGTGLKNLKAEDLTVENNKVVSVTPAADGKSATVKLESELVIDEATKVTFGEKEFSVTYTVDASEISIVEATYDDDTKNQFVAIQVNGKDITAQELLNAGYDLTFKAYATKAAATEYTTVFDNDTTGLLNSDLYDTPFLNEVDTALGTDYSTTGLPVSGQDIYVQVTMTKGSDVVVSPLTKVKIQNVDLAADGITDVEITNNNDLAPTGSDPFVMNSLTMVTGETADVTGIKVKAGDEVEEVNSNYTVKSSDPAVISVDASGTMTAQGPGTATITINYGTTSTTKTITVKNDKREVSKVSVGKNVLNVATTGQVSTTVEVFDQYGDPMDNVTLNLENSDDDVASVEDGAGNPITSITTDTDPSANPVEVFFVGGTKAGATTLTFRDASNVKIGTTTIKVNNTLNNTLAKYSLDIDTKISSQDITALDVFTSGNAPATKADVSTDATLDIQADKFLKIDITGLNSQNGVVEATTQEVDGTNGDYTVTVQESRAGVIEEAVAQDGFIAVEAGTKTGTATLVVVNAANNNIKATFKVTVTDVGYNVTGADLKTVADPNFAQTFTYENVLTLKDSDNDPVVSGIKLTKSVAQPIRIDIDAGANDTHADADVGALYIDRDANGFFDNNDILVGELQVTTTGSIAAVGPFDVVNGVAVATGDEGTVLFKVVDKTGSVVATRAINVDF